MRINAVSTLFFALATTTIAQSASSSWPGWSDITHIFSFGDSYTDTNFLINSTQPNPSNPLGNPAFPGRTFSNGRNWLDILTYNFNESAVLTYNLARGGASVDSFGDENNQFRPFDLQVDKFFVPNYATNVSRPANLTVTKPQWRGNNTLFTAFFGINDINASYRLSVANRTILHDTIFATYKRLINTLYSAGARNFVFLNVPAVHRAPLTVQQANSNAMVAARLEAIQDFNKRLDKVVKDFVKNRTEITAFLFDNFNLFNGVLDDPRSRTETKGYTNTTGFCPAYSARTYNESSFNPVCSIPQKQYFWLDGLHPTPPIHEAMAADIAGLLRQNRFVGSNDSSSPSPTPSATGPETTSAASPTARRASTMIIGLTTLWLLSIILGM